jgi:hypothetical protein
MLVFFSGRRLKPGTYDEFREAWMPEDEELPEGMVTIYHARNVKDENEVISFGLFDVDRDALDQVRGDEEDELKRQEAMARFVDDVPLEGVYEVVEEIKP